MTSPAHQTSGERQVIRYAFDRAAILLVLAAVVHAIVMIVPLDAPLLNLTVNESPLFRVSADP